MWSREVCVGTAPPPSALPSRRDPRLCLAALLYLLEGLRVCACALPLLGGPIIPWVMRPCKINYNVMLPKTGSLKGLTYYERAMNRWILVCLWDHLNSENKQRSLCGAWVYGCVWQEKQILSIISEVYLFLRVAYEECCKSLLAVVCFLLVFFVCFQCIISYLAQKQASKLINYITSTNVESKQSCCKHRGNNTQTQHFPEGAYVNHWFLFLTSEGTAILIGLFLQKILQSNTSLELLNETEKWWKCGRLSNNQKV